MRSNTVAVPASLTVGEEDLVPLASARIQLARHGRRPSKQRVLALGALGEIEVRLVAGRFVVTAESIRAHLARRIDKRKRARAVA